MNFKQLLALFVDELSPQYEREELEVIYYILVKQISGLQRMQLSGHQEEIAPAEADQYAKSLKALKDGLPLQYVMGETVFYGLPFSVNPSVLIPRPETEELVEWLLEETAKDAAILDIGTGSGCIAVSLKKMHPEASVSGLDISEDALEIARHNALINNVDVQFISADIFSFNTSDKFDVIVSNPPYITLSEQDTMAARVLENEPHLALFVPDEDPLLFYSLIAGFAKDNLRPNGKLFFEINAGYGAEVVQMLTAKSFNNIVLKKDLNNNDRMVMASIC